MRTELKILWTQQEEHSLDVVIGIYPYIHT